MLTPCYVTVLLDSSGMCSNVPSKSVVLCLQVPLDPDILHISQYWSKCLIGVSSFWNGLLFFFRPPAYLFAKKRTLNNELTKGGLMLDHGNAPPPPPRPSGLIKKRKGGMSELCTMPMHDYCSCLVHSVSWCVVS